MENQQEQRSCQIATRVGPTTYKDFIEFSRKQNRTMAGQLRAMVEHAASLERLSDKIKKGAKS